MICVAVVGVSLPFIVNRDLTLKRWPEKLTDFVFNSHWRRSCEKELCWAVLSSHAVPVHRHHGLLRGDTITVSLNGGSVLLVRHLSQEYAAVFWGFFVCLFFGHAVWLVES